MGPIGKAWWSISLLLVSALLSAEEGVRLRILAHDEPPFMVAPESPGQPPEGLAIDVARALFSEVDIDHEFVFVPPKRAFSFAATQPGACVIALERSQEREARLTWIGPFLITRHAVYRLRQTDRQVRSLDDLKGLRIGAALGSAAAEYLEVMGFEVDLAPRNDLVLKKLQLGRNALWASDTLSASLLIREQGLSEVVQEKVFLTTLREMACHKSLPAETARQLADGLRTLYQRGDIHKIYKPYLGQQGNWLIGP